MGTVVVPIERLSFDVYLVLDWERWKRRVRDADENGTGKDGDCKRVLQVANCVPVDLALYAYTYVERTRSLVDPNPVPWNRYAHDLYFPGVRAKLTLGFAREKGHAASFCVAHYASQARASNRAIPLAVQTWYNYEYDVLWRDLAPALAAEGKSYRFIASRRLPSDRGGRGVDWIRVVRDLGGTVVPAILWKILILDSERAKRAAVAATSNGSPPALSLLSRESSSSSRTSSPPLPVPIPLEQQRAEALARRYRENVLYEASFLHQLARAMKIHRRVWLSMEHIASLARDQFEKAKTALVEAGVIRVRHARRRGTEAPDIEIALQWAASQAETFAEWRRALPVEEAFDLVQVPIPTPESGALLRSTYARLRGVSEFIAAETPRDPATAPSKRARVQPQARRRFFAYRDLAVDAWVDRRLVTLTMLDDEQWTTLPVPDNGTGPARVLVRPQYLKMMARNIFESVKMLAENPEFDILRKRTLFITESGEDPSRTLFRNTELAKSYFPRALGLVPGKEEDFGGGVAMLLMDGDSEWSMPSQADFCYRSQGPHFADVPPNLSRVRFVSDPVASLGNGQVRASLLHEVFDLTLSNSADGRRLYYSVVRPESQSGARFPLDVVHNHTVPAAAASYTETLQIPRGKYDAVVFFSAASVSRPSEWVRVSRWIYEAQRIAHTAPLYVVELG